MGNLSSDTAATPTSPPLSTSADSPRSHAHRHRRIWAEILRREQEGEVLTVRAIHGVTGGSFRTISRILNTHRANQGYLSGPANHLPATLPGEPPRQTPGERDRLLRLALATAHREILKLRQQRDELLAKSRQQEAAIAAHQDSLARFEGHLAPIWREMANHLDLLRRLQRLDLPRLLATLDHLSQTPPNLPATPEAKRLAKLESDKQQLIRQLFELESRLAQVSTNHFPGEN